MDESATCETCFDSDYSSVFMLPRLCPMAKMHNFYAPARPMNMRILCKTHTPVQIL